MQICMLLEKLLKLLQALQLKQFPLFQVPPEFARERPQSVERCAACQCANVEDHERGPIVKLNCSHSFHRDCLQECMDAGDLTLEDACPVRCHLGLPDMPLVSQEEDYVS